MKKSAYPVAQNPLILRFHRLVDAFAKSDDERDFYLDRVEGFILFVDLDKGQKELDDLAHELQLHADRYSQIPKMTLYEGRKFMEGFVNEKVYDIDTKEKLLDIIQAKDARENFLEFIYDHLSEVEKWQQYYTERMRVRVIEWLRAQNYIFVFEEDLDIPRPVMEKVKQSLFEAKVPKDIASAREAIFNKSQVYYSSEALNPRPKRGRPPKQQAKIEVEPQLTGDIFTTVPPACRPFLYLLDITSGSSSAFSSRFGTEAEFLANLKGTTHVKIDKQLEELSIRLDSLRQLSTQLMGTEEIIGDQETKLLRAVSQQPAAAAQEEHATAQPQEISDIAQGVLPRKKDPRGKETAEASPRASSVKKVTPIHYKKKR